MLMTMTRLRLSLIAVLLVCTVLPAAADAARPVFIGDQFHGRLARPKVLSLWASDALMRLRWRGWGTSTARASGKVSTHAYGRYSYSPAAAIASDPAVCNGRIMYTRLRYKAFGHWHDAELEDCRFAATS
jgi:hypothetical protein